MHPVTPALTSKKLIEYFKPGKPISDHIFEKKNTLLTLRNAQLIRVHPILLIAEWQPHIDVHVDEIPSLWRFEYWWIHLTGIYQEELLILSFQDFEQEGSQPDLSDAAGNVSNPCNYSVVLESASPWGIYNGSPRCKTKIVIVYPMGDLMKIWYRIPLGHLFWHRIALQ